MELKNLIDLSSPEGETSKIKNLMGKGRPGILKSKFLTVLGNSNELLNRISNKLDITLDLSSSDSDYCDDDDETLPPVKFPIITEDDSIDFSAIDFDARRVKARRAHEEIISGRFRHPNLIPRMAPKTKEEPNKQSTSTSSGGGSSKNSFKNSSNSNSIDSNSLKHEDSNDLDDLDASEKHQIEVHNCDDIDRKTPEIDVKPPSVDLPYNRIPLTDNNSPNINGTQKPSVQKISNSSTLTSLNDPIIPMSGSLESCELKNWIRSESENSVLSWASSISLDARTSEEVSIKEFMKEFVEILFTNCSEIGFELKSEFGLKARNEIGRLWFSRFVNAQRTKSKRVEETTFYSLVQHFAIILFECNESEDYSPAKSLMNMCFTFYHEIDVPGCEPYREYLFTYLRQQPIWHTLRFWNAAFFDALQNERAHHRPVPKIKNLKLRNKHKKDKKKLCQNKSLDDSNIINNPKQNCLKEEHLLKNNSLPQSENDESSSSDYQEEDLLAEEINEDTKYHQNITFGQLGTFTCNMHAFGLNRDLCFEFLEKQCIISSLPKEQQKLLQDNVNRMYHETEKWGA